MNAIMLLLFALGLLQADDDVINHDDIEDVHYKPTPAPYAGSGRVEVKQIKQEIDGQ